MGTKVQSKTYFPGSMTDLNNGFHNGVWDRYHDDKSRNLSSPPKSQHFDYFLTTQAMDGYTGYAKEQIRQTILKHESIFRNQLQELHRLYKRQRDLMNPVPPETSKFGHLLTQLPPHLSKDTHIFSSSFPLDSTFTPRDSTKGKSTLHEFGPPRQVIDLELPANVNQNFQNTSMRKGFNLADLNEPVQVEESTFSSSFINKNTSYHLTKELQKHDLSEKSTLFGVKISKRNNTPTFYSSNSQPRTVNSGSTFILPSATLHHNHWIGSFHPTSQNSSASISFLNGINSNDSVSDNLKEINSREKNTFLDMWKNREAPQQTLPHWLTQKPKETKIHHINLDSLQNHSLQFFKKLKSDETNNLTTILGVPILDKKVKSQSQSQTESKNLVSTIDLNVSLDEEDPPSFPESVVKIATMEIDLEAESDNSQEMSSDLETVKFAAEAIISISTSNFVTADETLLWFAAVITDFENKSVNLDDENVPEGMDYFEYMTLKLQESEEKYDNYKLTIVEKEKEEDDDVVAVNSSKRTPRKGQGKRGRQKKDFQKDILPSIVSLSRREVSEDIQIFEEAFSASGVSWQSKRKSGGRGRRRLVAAESSCNPPPPVVAAVEESVCREIALEKTLGGWGRRTRRLPRQRCQNGGGHHQSLALKC